MNAVLQDWHVLRYRDSYPVASCRVAYICLKKNG